MSKAKYLVGIDEAGRGPLAGPVAVGVVCVPRDFNWRLIPGVGDSKQVKEKNREAIFLLAKRLKQEKVFDYAVTLVSAKIIDQKGISKAVQIGIDKGLRKLALSENEVEVKLDGLLQAPAEYRNQETIIKGDDKELVIGLASILAKVTRDTYMKKLAKNNEYLAYEFATHKGYGTKMHREAIVQNGLSGEHRVSFCKSLLALEYLKPRHR